MIDRRELVEVAEAIIEQVQTSRHEARRFYREVLQLMGVTQADLDAISTKLDQYGTDLAAGEEQIKQELADLKAANPDLNLDGINAGLDKIAAARDALNSDVAANLPSVGPTSPTDPSSGNDPQDASQVNANQTPVPDVTNTNVVPDPQVPIIGQDGQQTQPSVDPGQPSDPSQPQQPSDAGTATEPSDPSASAAATDPSAVGTQPDPADPATTDAQVLAAQGDDPAAVGGDPGAPSA